MGFGVHRTSVTMERDDQHHRPERAELGGTFHGSAQVVWSFATQEQVVALTFDDGPHPRLTPPVLDALEAHGAAATFFVVGQAARRHPELVQRAAAAGHESATTGSGPSCGRRHRCRRGRT